MSEEEKKPRVKVGKSPFGMKFNSQTGNYESTEGAKPKKIEPNQSKKDREDAAKAALDNEKEKKEKKEKDGS